MVFQVEVLINTTIEKLPSLFTLRSPATSILDLNIIKKKKNGRLLRTHSTLSFHDTPGAAAAAIGARDCWIFHAYHGPVPP